MPAWPRRWRAQTPPERQERADQPSKPSPFDCASGRLYAAIDGVELQAARALSAAGSLAATDPHVQPTVGSARRLEAPDDARALARDLLLVDQQTRLRLEHATARPAPADAPAL